MKKTSLILALFLVLSFSVFAMASVDEESTKKSDSNNSAVKEESDDPNSLGEFSVIIDSCRFAKDYNGKDVVIVKYIFKNVSNEHAPTFAGIIKESAFQNGIGLSKAYLLSKDANFSTENQFKEVKKGASIEVEVAYTLEDTTSPIEVEVTRWRVGEDKTVTRTFTFQ